MSVHTGQSYLMVDGWMGGEAGKLERLMAGKLEQP